jgi:autotransporter-associated beta strand protein
LNNNLTVAKTVNNGTISLYGVISGTGDLNIGNTGSITIASVVEPLSNVGTVYLGAINTYSGGTLVNSGTLKLGPAATSDSSALISIAAGATLDTSSIAAFALGGATTMEAKGTGTTTGTTAARIQGASGGVVNLGNRPIHLTFTPSAFSGDATHPPLLVSQGNLTLDNNTLTVNNASGTALDLGVYRLIQVTSGTIVENASPFYPVSVTGAGLVAGTAATVSVSSGNLIMTVATASSTAYDTWATSQGLSGAAADASADPDADGLSNALEFVLGGQPNPANPGSNSLGLLPTVTTNAGKLLFTYRVSDLSLTQPGVAITPEYGSSLTGWAQALDGVLGVTITVTNDGFGSGIDKVEVSIPQSLATDAKLFARLKVTLP